jgi:hypothetical protein
MGASAKLCSDSALLTDNVAESPNEAFRTKVNQRVENSLFFQLQRALCSFSGWLEKVATRRKKIAAWSAKFRSSSWYEGATRSIAINKGRLQKDGHGVIE